jgi:NAD(P)-dependent dehydrogenase (short-subunit alcohol dehydrogenase family)
MFTSDALAGKTILITGGGSGLGLNMAQRFLELGAKVAICGRDETKLIEAKRNHPALWTSTCDVRDYTQVSALFDKLIDQVGMPNCLVNNAAGNFLCPSEELSPNAFRIVVDIVLQGSFNCTSNFGKRLIEKKLPGSIINIVTTYTEVGSSFVLPSACAKAGVHAMTTSLAYEWATYGIRVNSIAPGPFPTKGAWDRLVPNSNLEESFKARVPAGRFGEPQELSNLAAFLLSDMAPYITGECVTIDGGERLNGGQFNFVAQSMPRPELKAFLAQFRKDRSRA